MIAFLIMLGAGFFGGTMVQKTHVLCECKRSNFDGQYCQSIKPEKDFFCEVK
jgi:hypothetical protein